MPSDQSRTKEEAKFGYSPLGKAFVKQIKTTEDQGIKQVEVLKTFKPDENKEYIKSNYTYNFQQYQTISFGHNIYTDKINIAEAEMDQSNLLKNIVEFNNKSRSRMIERKDKKRYL